VAVAGFKSTAICAKRCISLDPIEAARGACEASEGGWGELSVPKPSKEEAGDDVSLCTTIRRPPAVEDVVIVTPAFVSAHSSARNPANAPSEWQIAAVIGCATV
jgi:hypothetical protein